MTIRSSAPDSQHHDAQGIIQKKNKGQHQNTQENIFDYDAQMSKNDTA